MSEIHRERNNGILVEFNRIFDLFEENNNLRSIDLKGLTKIQLIIDCWSNEKSRLLNIFDQFISMEHFCFLLRYFIDCLTHLFDQHVRWKDLLTV